MTKPNKLPSFASWDLQEALKEVQPALEGAEAARNRVSEDIKALESYLESLDLKTTLRFPLGREGVIDPRGDVFEAALTWGPDATGRNRLLYETSYWNGRYNSQFEFGFWEVAEASLERESRPLIETKFEIRKEMFTHLPDFVRAMGEAVRIPHVEDIPF